MSSEFVVEQQIRKEVEQLRGQFSNTQELYREVCMLLFFRFGISPTANKLYQLVRKGSMSAPAEALAKFWEDLREKSRVRIEHPDLPEELKTEAGNLTAALWTKAQELSNKSLASFKEDAAMHVRQAQVAQLATEARYGESLEELQIAKQTLGDQESRIQAFVQALAAVEATRISLHEQLTQSREECRRLQEAIVEARREFSNELEKLRTSATLATNRYEAAEERWLLEIDRERTLAKKLHKELTVTRVESAKTGDRQREEVARLQEELGDVRRRSGILEGSLNAERSAKQHVIEELATLRSNVAETIRRERKRS